MRRPRYLYRSLILAGGVVLAAGVFLFTQQMINRLSREVATTSTVIARFLAQASFPATHDTQLQQIVTELIDHVDFPIVVTDTTGMPRAWRQLEIRASDVAPESIDSLAAGMPIAPQIQRRIDRVRSHIVELDRHNAPVAMIHGSGIKLGYVHYGEPRVLHDLRWVPLVSVAGVALLLGLGLFGLAQLRAAERRMIWVGMAKETAHQLGTPLSSLMGWLELLRGHAQEESVPRAALDETVHEMERDVDRLNRVAQRFSQVGSAPTLAPADPCAVVREVVSYMRRRVPQRGNPIEITEQCEEVDTVMLNAELLAWTLENLIANAVSAMERGGRIDVVVSRVNAGVEITVTDTGRGMSSSEQRRAFEAGYTTKRRGWGLGLALARRVIEEYHRGRIFIRRSTPGEGTTMAIRLPGVATG